MADNVITSVVNTPSDQIVRKADDNTLTGDNTLSGDNQFTGTNKFGSATDYTQFDTAGHQKMIGEATVFRDEFNELIKAGLNNPSSKISQDLTEGVLTYTNTATPSDYAIMNVQINHDYLLDSTVHPHIHWFQAENNTPNWLIEYRWQNNGDAKVTSWTPYAMTTNVFTYSSGEILQISYGAGITPSGIGISSVLQMKISRDVGDSSGAFGASDLYSTSVSALFVDVHIETDSLGSNTEYAKE